MSVVKLFYKILDAIYVSYTILVPARVLCTKYITWDRVPAIREQGLAREEWGARRGGGGSEFRLNQ